MGNSQAKIYTVSEITKKIKDIVENNFPSVWIEGEVSNYSKSQRGHVYLTLKDEKAQLSCIAFSNYAEEIEFELKDGLHILCFGRISIYDRQGKYQLYIEKIEPKGYGALQLAFEQLKAKLEKEGLFKEEYKKPIPLLPSKIGIVTSPTGAAIKDILDVIRKRFPEVNILINAARVQGKEASSEIAKGIEQLNKFKDIDVIIIGRGGGSLEDLWPFNEEIVARAIRKSKIPIISAVGHQRDYTISDFVADARAATPSKAAEMVIAKKKDLQEKLTNFNRRLRSGLKSKSQRLDKKLTRLVHSRFFKNPEGLISDHQLYLDDLSTNLGRNFLIFAERKEERLKDYAGNLYFRKPHLMLKEPYEKLRVKKDIFHQSFSRYFDAKKEKYKNYISKLEALSPLSVLKRGYSITKNVRTNKIIKGRKDVKVKDIINVRISDGKIIGEVKELNEAQAYGETKKQ